MQIDLANFGTFWSAEHAESAAQTVPIPSGASPHAVCTRTNRSGQVGE